MINFQIQIQGNALEKLKVLGLNVNGIIKETLQYGALMIKGKAKEKSPIDKGILRASITETGVSGNEIRVISPVEYAKYQEFGTGIYAGKGMIYPKRARFLAWKNKSGKWVFAKAVRGVKGKRFFGQAIDYFIENIDKVKKFILDRVKYYYG